jgi:hypothetical protein
VMINTHGKPEVIRKREDLDAIDHNELMPEHLMK